jgi:hypothetical protein
MKKLQKQEKSSLQKYFEKVKEVSGSGEPFPVNLDEVWPLAYPRKDHAVRDLRETGIEGVDFQFFPNFGEQNLLKTKGVSGGRNKDDYRISVPCLEWLIARRVRAVFEVYRRVFHGMTGTAGSFGTAETADGFEGLDYMDVLRSAGLSVRSGSFWKRIRKYPQEFRHEAGVWTVSLLLAEVIRQQTRMRETYRRLGEKREVYLREQLALELGF